MKLTRPPIPKASPSSQQGFSMIELMLVIAILGIMAAVALPAYQSHIRTAQMGKVIAQYEESKRLVENIFVRSHSQQALNQRLTQPTDTNGWIVVFDTLGAPAPGGGTAFVDGAAVDATGQIGVSYSGTFPSTAQVVLDLPAYLDITAQTATIRAADSL